MSIKTNAVVGVAAGFSLLVYLIGAMAAGAQTPPTSGVQSARGSLVGVRAELDKSLDASKVKAGDGVTAKPEAKIHLPNGVDLTRHDRLVGRVDTVQASVNHGNSAISVTFYEARLKDGRKVPIKATILWIGQAPNQLDPAVVSAPADRTTPGVGVETGGSLSGNLVPVVQGGQGAEITGGPVHRGGQPASQLPEGLSSQRNAVPGVNFFSDVGRSDSGWFRTTRGNVFVPSGTVLALAVVVLADGAVRP